MAPTHDSDSDVWQVAMQLAWPVRQLDAHLPTTGSGRFGVQKKRYVVSITSTTNKVDARDTKDCARPVARGSGTQSLRVTTRELRCGPFATSDRANPILLQTHQSLARRLKAEFRVPSYEFR